MTIIRQQYKHLKHISNRRESARCYLNFFTLTLYSLLIRRLITAACDNITTIVRFVTYEAYYIFEMYVRTLTYDILTHVSYVESWPNAVIVL